MPTTRKYKNPPLVEAVFEIFFVAKNWTPIIPGLFYNEIKASFPNINQAPGSGFGISFNNAAFQIGAGTNDLTQYKSKDNTTIIQLSNGLFTVNKLAKYEGWESYREVILNAFTALEKVLEIGEITRFGLKTINKIDIKERSYDALKASYNFYPSIPDVLVQNVNAVAVQLQIETPIIPETEILALSLATLRKEQEYEAPTVFQLYYTRIKDNSDIKIETWLETAHLALHNAFETAVTDQIKKTFDA